MTITVKLHACEHAHLSIGDKHHKTGEQLSWCNCVKTYVTDSDCGADKPHRYPRCHFVAKRCNLTCTIEL